MSRIQTHLDRSRRALVCIVAALGSASCGAEDPEVPAEEEVAEATEAIIGGSDDLTDTIRNATVYVNNGCSGTLVRDDLVITAGHCMPDLPPPDGTSEIPCDDWETNGEWYDISASMFIPINVGAERLNVHANSATSTGHAIFVVDSPGNLDPTDTVTFTVQSTGKTITVDGAGGPGTYVMAHTPAIAAATPLNVVYDWTFPVPSGPVWSGDRVLVRTATGGADYWQVDAKNHLKAAPTSYTPSMSFTIYKVNASGVVQSGVITDGDLVSFKADNDLFVQATNGGVGPWLHATRAIAYSVPRRQDIILLQLETPVPPNAAVPMDVMHRTPGAGSGAAGSWHDWFCVGSEVCRVGDFDGDGRDDVAAFIRGASGNVWIGLSSGSSFTSSLWASGICTGTKDCHVGDVNDDGKDDIVVFTKSTVAGAPSGDVHVALSTGSGFGPLTKYHESACFGADECAVGDVDGDGAADLVVFYKSTHGGIEDGDVMVALRSGASFGVLTKAHEWFCVGSEVCGVGQFGLDRRADLVAFAKGAGNDVWVAHSIPGGFGPSSIWHDSFCPGAEQCRIGDFDGDGRDDVASFHRGAAGDPARGQVRVALSNGVDFVGSQIWGSICTDSMTCEVADFSGDGRADLAGFVKSTIAGGRAGDLDVAVTVAESIVSTLSSRHYKIAGWGFDGVEQAVHRQRAGATFAGYPNVPNYDSFNQATFDVDGTAAAGPGDSGGPLMWLDPLKGTFVLMSVLQQAGSGGFTAHTLTFGPGGNEPAPPSCAPSPLVRPNIGAWYRKAAQLD